MNGFSWLDVVLLTAGVLAIVVAVAGVIEALLAPALLGRWPFRFGVVRAPRSRGQALLEFSMWLLWGTGMLLSRFAHSWSSWAMLLTLLAMSGVLWLSMRRRSHAGTGRG